MVGMILVFGVRVFWDLAFRILENIYVYIYIYEAGTFTYDLT